VGQEGKRFWLGTRQRPVVTVVTVVQLSQKKRQLIKGLMQQLYLKKPTICDTFPNKSLTHSILFVT